MAYIPPSLRNDTMFKVSGQRNEVKNDVKNEPKANSSNHSNKSNSYYDYQGDHKQSNSSNRSNYSNASKSSKSSNRDERRYKSNYTENSNSLEAENQRLKDFIETLKSEKRSYKRDLDEANRAIETLNYSLQEFENDHEKVKINIETIKELESEITELKIKLEKANNNVALYKGDRDECVPKSMYIKAIEELNAIKKEKYEIHRELRDLKTLRESDDIVAKDKEIEKLKNEIEKIKKDRDTRIKSLSDQHVSMENEIEELRNQIDEMNGEGKNKNDEFNFDDLMNMKTMTEYVINNDLTKKIRINKGALRLTLDVINQMIQKFEN